MSDFPQGFTNFTVQCMCFSCFRKSLPCHSSAQFRGVTQSCLTLRPNGQQHTRLPCPSLTPESTQTHVHHNSDAIQPSHLLSSPSPPTFNVSQHQGLFQGVCISHQVANVLEFQLQHQSFQ